MHRLPSWYTNPNPSCRYPQPSELEQRVRDEQREELRKVLDAEPYYNNRAGCDLAIELARQNEPIGLIRDMPEHVFGRRKGHGAFPNSRLSGR
jgi:hypothetical protein